MVSRRKTDSKDSASRRRPATTPDARENQLISLAIDLAEKQMREGTASSQVISHYLKLGTPREQLEREKLQRENDLLRTKAEALESAKRSEEMYTKALESMRLYAGHIPIEPSDD